MHNSLYLVELLPGWYGHGKHEALFALSETWK